MEVGKVKNPFEMSEQLSIVSFASLRVREKPRKTCWLLVRQLISSQPKPRDAGNTMIRYKLSQHLLHFLHLPVASYTIRRRYDMQYPDTMRAPGLRYHA